MVELLATGGHEERRVIDLPFPRGLQPFLETYLELVRPRLLKQAAGKQARLHSSPEEHVWIAGTGGTTSKDAMYAMTTTSTLTRFGVAVNSHLFRDCLASTLERANLGWDDTAHARTQGACDVGDALHRDWGVRQQRLFHQHVAALRENGRPG